MIFDPARIEEELSDIMVRSSPTEARVSLLNLVLFSTAAREAQADSLLQAVLGRRAARVIHITRTDEEESQVSVSARCYLDHSNRSVCLQEVVISNGRDGIGARASSWAPLLIRDIPVYVVWLDCLSGSVGIPAAVIELADTLIFDSEASLRSGEGPRELFAYLAQLARIEGTALCDLTWRRVAPLCGALADSFDAPQMLQQIDAITSVTVTGGPPAFGRLFLAWFASRLDLRPTDTRHGDARLSHPRQSDERGAMATRQRPEAAAERDRGVAWVSSAAHGREVRLVHRQPQPLDGDLQVEIRSEGHATLHLRAVSGGCIEVQQEETEKTVQVLQWPDDGEIVLREIDSMRHDHIYAQTVATLDTFDKKP